MHITIDPSSSSPLYMQIHDCIVAGIATKELAPGEALPSIRSLASDLEINLHTVNKAYALLRDEGYLRMQGRKGATITQPAHANETLAAQAAQSKMEEDLFKLALAYRARGGSRNAFLKTATVQAIRAYELTDAHDDTHNLENHRENK